MNRPLASHPRFALGRIIALDIARDLLFAGCYRDLLHRHVRGDWGDIPESDRLANESALREGARLFSSYRASQYAKVWIVTEADRSITTIVHWEDYPPIEPVVIDGVMAPSTQPAQQTAASDPSRKE